MTEALVETPTVAQLLPLIGRGPEAFARDVGGWLLVGHLPDEGAAWFYRTGTVNTARAMRAATGELEAMLDADWAAWTIKKRVGNQFPDTVFVGRSTSNDITIPHTSISKLHARLRYGDGGPLLPDGGSSNGTMLNGDPVGTGVDVAVAHGDLVRFGSLVFQCFEPRLLHNVLERFASTR